MHIHTISRYLHLIASAVGLCAAGICGAQTFNTLPDLGVEYSALHGLVATDSCLYVAGSTWSEPDPDYLLVFAKLSLSGEVLWTSSPMSDERELITWDETLVALPNGNLAVAGTTHSLEVEALNAFILELSPEGEVVHFFEFDHPLYPDSSWYRVTSLALDSDGNYLLTSNLTGLNFDYTQMYIQRIAPDGTELWHREVGEQDMIDMVEGVLETDTHFWAYGVMTNADLVQSGFTFEPKIVKLNKADGTEDGNFEIDTTEPLWKIDDMVQLESGNLILSGSLGHEELAGEVGIFYTQNFVAETDPEGQLLHIQTTGSWGIQNEWSSIRKPLDGPFLVSGARYTINGETVPDEARRQATVAAYDANGNLEWENLIKAPIAQTEFSAHYVYDAQLCASDGGVIALGYYFDPLADVKTAWIFKTDAQGCVVEDCPSTGIDETATVQRTPLAYPNPAARTVHVNHGMEHQHLTILNALGQPVHTQTLHGTGSTSIDCSDWEMGVYLLRFECQDGTFQTVRFQKQ